MKPTSRLVERGKKKPLHLNDIKELLNQPSLKPTLSWDFLFVEIFFFFNVFYLSQFELASKSIMIEAVPENTCGRGDSIYSVIVIEHFEMRE